MPEKAGHRDDPGGDSYRGLPDFLPPLTSLLAGRSFLVAMASSNSMRLIHSVITAGF
jgi:hypothetical protein